ncbi:sterol desaturase family protein [Methylococcus sp. EFPC2]|nr:sterol desaturase family protein [Methylococcus sp. EFPC2]
MLYWLLGIPLGLLAENFGEWAVHRFVLHGLGKRKTSIWAYHWHDHHRVTRRLGMLDPAYRRGPRPWNTSAKELLMLGSIFLLHVPLTPLAPGYVTGMYAGLILYFCRHRKAHLNPAWAREHLPWHYQHHMGTPEANWCVSWPWFDWILGTRVIPDTGREPQKKSAGGDPPGR